MCGYLIRGSGRRLGERIKGNRELKAYGPNPGDVLITIPVVNGVNTYFYDRSTPTILATKSGGSFHS